MTNYTLHKLSEGFVVSSDEEIIQNDTCLNWYNNPLTLMYNINVGGKDWEENKKGFLKVIAQQHQIDFSALSEDEQKEIGWFDVDKLADNKYPLHNILHLQLNTAIKTGYQEGFQKAQELLSDRRFTLEDMGKAMEYAAEVQREFSKYGTTRKTHEKYLQSLSQKSWKIELEMEYWKNSKVYDQPDIMLDKPIPKWLNGKIKITKIL